MAMATEISLDGLTYNLDDRDRVAAQVAVKDVSATAQWRRNVDSSTLNTGSDVTTTLSRGQSGTLFVLDGTGDLVVNMPALSTENVGVTYKFVVVTAVAADKTATFVLPGSDVSDWAALLHLTGNASTCATTIDVDGDTLTMPNSTVVGSQLEVTCMTDDGTNSRWHAEFFGTPVMTNA